MASEFSDILHELQSDLADVRAIEAAIEWTRYPAAREPGACGGRFYGDASGRPVAAADLETKLEETRARAARRARVVRAALYGADGRGGVAAALGRAVADVIFSRYLDGMTWEQVGAELAKPGTKGLAAWARRRAKKAIEYADLVGIRRLVGA